MHTLRIRRTLAAFAALSLSAAACGDVVDPQASATLRAPADGSDLASTAVATLVTSRAGGFSIAIPDETRTESEAIVLHMHDGTIDRYRFVRRAGAWTLDRHLETTRPAAPDAAAEGPLLARGTWSTGVPLGTPRLGTTQFIDLATQFRSSVDVYPVHYDGSSTRRWTFSAEVVSGVQDPFDPPYDAVFTSSSALRWSTADSVFTVDAYRKWEFGDAVGMRKSCSAASAPTVPCSALGAVYTTAPYWADAHYHITVEKRQPTSIAVSPSMVTVKPGNTAQLTATVRDQHGSAMSAPISWSTSNPAVATVSASGVVTAHSIGDAVITATSGTLTATATVLGRPVVTLSGPTGPLSNQTATVTASVSPSGSYYYEWYYDRCDFRTGTWQCIYIQPLPSGQDVTQASRSVSQYDDFVRFHVYVRFSATAPILAQTSWKVDGGGQVFTSGGGGCLGRTC